jgi:hypothetical protein
VSSINDTFTNDQSLRQEVGNCVFQVYSLIQSCRLQNIDPVAYLRDISARMLAGDVNYDALTPAAMANANRKANEALASGK